MLTSQLFALLYHVLNGIDVDLPSIILKHLLHMIKAPSDTPLPYAKLLPEIFRYFSIDFAEEEKHHVIGELDEEFFDNMGIERTLTSELILKEQRSGALAATQRLGVVEFYLDSLRRDMLDFISEITDKFDE